MAQGGAAPGGTAAGGADPTPRGGMTTAQGTGPGTMTAPGSTTRVAPDGTTTTAPTMPGAATAGATGAAAAVDSATLATGRRATKLIGATVYNEQGESIGEVDNLIILPGGGNPVAVLSVGGFLGIGAKLVAVPYERLQMNAERNRWTLAGATREGLTAQPTFTYEAVGGERRG